MQRKSTSMASACEYQYDEVTVKVSMDDMSFGATIRHDPVIAFPISMFRLLIVNGSAHETSLDTNPCCLSPGATHAR